jgi:hypothetical protein
MVLHHRALRGPSLISVYVLLRRIRLQVFGLAQNTCLERVMNSLLGKVFGLRSALSQHRLTQT